MSTQININVNSGGLLSRNQQDATANRSGNLLKENSNATADRGKRERKRELSAKSLNAQRRPAVTAPFEPKNRIEEPAASPDLGTIGHVWAETSLGELGSDPPGVIIDALKTSTSGIPASLPRFGVSQRLRSGKGISSIAVGTPEQDLGTPAPSSNYTWTPAGYGWYWVEANDAYWAYAYGPRKFLLDERSSGGGSTLTLPAGKDKFVIIRSSARFYWSLQLTCTHSERVFAASGFPQPGELYVPPGGSTQEPFPVPYDYFGAPEAQFAGHPALVPGGTVDIGGPPSVCPGDWPERPSCQPIEPAMEPLLEEYITPYIVNHYVFLCSNNSIKQIRISPTLQAFLNWIVPGIVQYQARSVNFIPQPTAPYYRTINYSVPSYSDRTATINSINASSSVYSFEAPGVPGVNRVTPRIYELINNVYPFTSASNLKSVFNTRHRMRPDTRVGSYSQGANFDGDRYLQNLPLCYAKNRRTAPSDELGKKEFCLNLSISRPMDQVNSRGLTAVWDWDDPAYCKARLNDLGISAADLAS